MISPFYACFLPKFFLASCFFQTFQQLIRFIPNIYKEELSLAEKSYSSLQREPFKIAISCGDDKAQILFSSSWELFYGLFFVWFAIRKLVIRS